MCRRKVSNEAPYFDLVRFEVFFFEVDVSDFIFEELVAEDEVVSDLRGALFEVIGDDHVSSPEAELEVLVGVLDSALLMSGDIFYCFLVVVESRHCIEA